MIAFRLMFNGDGVTVVLIYCKITLIHQLFLVCVHVIHVSGFMEGS